MCAFLSDSKAFGLISLHFYYEQVLKQFLFTMNKIISGIILVSSLMPQWGTLYLIVILLIVNVNLIWPRIVSSCDIFYLGRIDNEL